MCHCLLASSASPGSMHCLQASSGTRASMIPPGITKGYLAKEFCQQERRRCCQPADDYRLPCTAERLLHGEPPFDVTKYKKGEQSDDHGDNQGRMDRAIGEIRSQGNQPTSDVRTCDGQRTATGSLWVGFFQAQLELHHEIDPSVLVAADCFDHRGNRLLGQTVGSKYQGHFLGFPFRHFHGLPFFGSPLRGVVFGICPRGQ